MTFVLILLWVGYRHWRADGSLASTAAGVFFLLLLFACVLLHEFGHALMARRFGIATRDIILLPIGGVARLEHMPEKPRQELWVALAGPTVNLAIAAVLFALLSVMGGLQPWDRLGIADGPLLQRLIPVNLFIMVFNLLPAFPMDGGRILRALLAMVMDYRKATSLATSIGRALAMGLGLLGLVHSPFLILIALFVWIGAGQEAGMVNARHTLTGVPLHRALTTRLHVLAPTDRLSTAIELTLATPQHDFPVAEGQTLVGLLTQNRLLEALADGGATQTVQRVMNTSLEPARIDQPTKDLFERMRAEGLRTLPVLHASGELAGLLTLDKIAELMQIDAALGN